jgi:PAS domain S-box-containing protein
MEESVKDYAILYTDTQGVVTFWSKGAERVFGYAEHEILGRPAAVLFTPEDREAGAPHRELDQAVETGHGEDVRWHLRKDGSLVFLNGVVTPIRDDEGGLRGFAKVATDATEQKFSEDRLREGEERHRAILESITDGFYFLDRDWRFTHVNPKAEVLLGRSGSDLLGKSVWEEFAFAVDTVFYRDYHRAMDENVAVTSEAFYPPHDRWYEVHAYPSPDGLSVFFRDIGERKRAEEALQESEKRIRAILTSITDAFFAVDRDWRFTYVNPQAVRILGRKTDELLGKVLWDEYPGLAGTEFERAYLRAVEEQVSTSVTAYYSDHDRWYEIRNYPAPDGLSVYFQDITDRRRQEEALRAAKDDAERANRAKDHFLAVLSHELRTPLNPILLAASSMLERTPAPDEVRPTLEMIRQNVKLQARLIDDLLDVMRIVQGKMPLHWSVSDCHALVEQSIEICRSEFLGKAQEVVLDLAAECHHVNADSARLHQVLWNLVRNAVKFTPEGGKITVRTRNEDDGDSRIVVIEVADTGIGIEPDVLPTIWDPFQQGETTITRRFGGLGLGLAICKGVVDAHGGSLAVESEGSGMGTTFRVLLKTLTDPVIEAEDGGEVRSLPPLNPMNILLVEDEAATLRLMTRLLNGLGHRVTAAGTVADAWTAFQTGDFDLIVSDIGLPDGTGLDLMRKVKAVRRVPAIALTGYGMDEDVRRSREAGFTTHMTKPIDFTKLEAVIRQVAN